MANKKDYFIKLFLKCSSWIYTAEKSLNANEAFLRSCYASTSEVDFKKVIDDYGIERFRKEFTHIIDETFSIEELESLIAFTRSPAGKKISDKNFLLKVGKAMDDLCGEREMDLSRMDRE